MLKFLCKWFNCGNAGSGDGAGGATRPGRELPGVDYNGFSIHPRPRRKNGGWTTEAVIRKRDDAAAGHDAGAAREHIFIRADASPGKDEAVALIVSKAKMLIDQQGDSIFS